VSKLIAISLLFNAIVICFANKNTFNALKTLNKLLFIKLLKQKSLFNDFNVFHNVFCVLFVTLWELFPQFLSH
jgi:hypothetical protein